jgi:hypothetical protein
LDLKKSRPVNWSLASSIGSTCPGKTILTTSDEVLPNYRNWPLHSGRRSRTHKLFDSGAPRTQTFRQSTCLEQMNLKAEVEDEAAVDVVDVVEEVTKDAEDEERAERQPHLSLLI